MTKDVPSVMKLLILILPVAALVFISGCTGTGGGAAGPGVVILNWEPDFSSVESQDDVQFRLRVQNQGGEEAENVRAMLTMITIGGDEWQILSGAEEVDLKPYLLPPNPRYGTEGETTEEIWKLRAPTIPEGLPPSSYSVGIRVFYDYVTTAIKPITLVNENELRQITDRGGALPTHTGSHSSGPLSVTAVTGKYIKVSDDGRTKTFPITIQVTNTGGGIPYYVGHGSMMYGIPEDSEYKVLLGINLPPGLGFVTCAEYDSTGSYSGGEVQLWKGRDSDITCELMITNLPAVSQEGSIKFYLTYGYAIDRTTAVSVKGF